MAKDPFTNAGLEEVKEHQADAATLICVAGAIGAGKTPLARKLGKARGGQLLEEEISGKKKGRIDSIAPMHGTRMGPAIRHATWKLEQHQAKSKFLFLISDGRPQDHGYGIVGSEKEYAINDTKMALLEAKGKNITPFCLTVDRNGHDYLKTMCQDMGYEVVADIESLPKRLPALYRKLTF